MQWFLGAEHKLGAFSLGMKVCWGMSAPQPAVPELVLHCPALLPSQGKLPLELDECGHEVPPPFIEPSVKNRVSNFPDCAHILAQVSHALGVRRIIFFGKIIAHKVKSLQQYVLDGSTAVDAQMVMSKKSVPVVGRGVKQRANEGMEATKVLVILHHKVHKVSLAQGTGKGLVSF